MFKLNTPRTSDHAFSHDACMSMHMCQAEVDTKYTPAVPGPLPVGLPEGVAPPVRRPSDSAKVWVWAGWGVEAIREGQAHASYAPTLDRCKGWLYAQGSEWQEPPNALPDSCC